jgi:hypothetical protein
MNAFAIGLCSAIVAAGSVTALFAAPTESFLPSDSAPAQWTRYASLVRSRVQDWLSADDERTRRLRASIEAHSQSRGAATPFVARLWFLDDGEISRAEFEGIAEADIVDLRALLASRKVGAPPPADMLQPLRLKLSLQVGI